MLTQSTPGVPSVRRERASFVRATKGFDLGLVATEVDPNDPRKYKALLDTQYEDFMTKHKGPGAESPAIHHGFMVVAVVASQIPQAYVDFLSAHSERPNFQELHATTEQGFEQILKPLADTDNRRNKVLETWIGIHEDAPNSYRFDRRTDELTVKLDTIRQIYAASEIFERETSGDLEPKDPTRKCPALEYILPKLWSAVVTGCIEIPEYFKHDVARALEAAEPQLD